MAKTKRATAQPKARTGLRSHDIVEAIEAMYGQEAVLVREVSNATGSRARRTLDAIAIGLWPSRGMYIHGIEVKVSLADLRRELATPAKADAVGCYCDAFWIAMPEVLWSDDLPIPGPWGVILVSENGVAKRSKQAGGLVAQSVDRDFVAALARSLVRQVGSKALQEKRDREAYSRAWKEVRAQMQAEVDGANAARDVAERKYNVIHNALQGADVFQLARAIAILRDLRGQYGSLNALRSNARDLFEKANELEAMACRMLPDPTAQPPENDE